MGSTKLDSLPESVRSRISYMSHNFFDPQPLEDADVYLLRMILHDWPDAEAATILKNHVQVLKKNPASRVLIMDTVLPTPGTAPVNEEALLRYRDLTMMQMFNSKEREVTDWEDLCRRVDANLVIRRVEKPFGSAMSVMEVVYEESDEFSNGDRVTATSGHTNGHTNGHMTSTSQ